MKFIEGLISIYSFVQSFLFFFFAFIPVFSNYLVDVSSIVSLFIIPVTFAILFFYTGYGLWEDKLWGYIIGSISYVSISLVEFFLFCSYMGTIAGFFHVLIGGYLIYDLFSKKI